MKKILRFYLSNTDTLRHASLYEEIARAAQREGLAGATVLQGIMGYGKASKLRSNKFWELNVKYPIVVEIIDDEDKLQPFLDKILPTLESQPKGILVTLQPVDIVLCK